MADITYCASYRCSKRGACERGAQPPDLPWVSMADFGADGRAECPHFRPARNRPPPIPDDSEAA